MSKTQMLNGSDLPSDHSEANGANEDSTYRDRDHPEVHRLRMIVSILRITLGIILLATWFENLTKGLYTAQGLTDFFLHPEWGVFTNGGGVLFGYRQLIEATVLKAPGLFGAFQLVAELLLGLALVIGIFTRLAAYLAAFFFLNLFLTYYGSAEWVWTYVLLAASALVVALTDSGRSIICLDYHLWRRLGNPHIPLVWHGDK